MNDLGTFNGRPMYYDKDGSPMALLEWATKFEDRAYQRVARDTVASGPKTYLVSTVWLGMDHNTFGTQPHIFETMVFEGDVDTDGRSMDDFTRRYSTLKQALSGHKAIIAEITKHIQEH